MASIMDVIFSIILGGTLLIITLETNSVAMEDAAMHHGDQMVQETAVSLSLYLDGQLRNMGFGVPDTQDVVLKADSTDIIYLVDLPPFNSIDTMRYFLGPTSDLASTPNSHDRFVYEQQGNETPHAIAVVTDLKFNYFDQNDTKMSLPVSKYKRAQILKVESTTEVQNSYALFRDKTMVKQGEEDALYSSFLWHQTRLATQNARVSARPAQKIRKTKPPPPPTPIVQGPVAPPRPKPPAPPPAVKAPKPAATGTGTGIGTGQPPKPPPTPPPPRPAPPPPPPSPPPPPVLGFS
jgi:hypothetical protein